MGLLQWAADIEKLRKQSSIDGTTKEEYKAKAAIIKQEILRRMFKEGLIGLADLENPQPPQPTKSKKLRVGKKVSLSKALPAHGKAVQPKTLYKYPSKFQGGLPSLGKRHS